MEKNILVTRSSMPDFEEYIEEIKPLWESHWLTNMGVKHQELESKLKEFFGVNRISLFTNGHLALELAIQALQLNGEVITTPFTFASTTHAIVRNGLTPVFCDINRENYTIDVEKIESLITENTCAIVAVHVYGNCCDVEGIEKIAKRHNLKVIYDAAHAFGITLKGRNIAEYGDISMFSFHATKVFNTIEGGALCFKDIDFGNRVNKLRNFGIINEEVVDYVGSNAKMNEFQAAMGICNLRNFSREISKRRKVVERYKKNLCNVNGIILCNEDSNCNSNYAYFPILVDKILFGKDRDEIYNELKGYNIFARKYFFPLTKSFKCYNKMFDMYKTPIADYVSNNILTLPLYADLELENVDRICNIIQEMR